MSFVDKAVAIVQAGNGGDGRVSFRHEKFVDRGGPDGGDGGDGGDVVFQASRNQNTLASFRYQKEIKAEAGEPGGKQRMHGKSGADLIVPVPVGTVISMQDGEVLADLAEDGQQAIIAKGGKGGFGNAHFVSSRRQAPKVAEKGERCEPFTVNLEIKMIADVGLVGLPNAGKSTLLSVISNARPEIANYPFTTLKPNLGVADIDKQTSLLFADIPGLIEGAAEGKGLGDDFLRHVERTAVLVHLIDAYQEDVAEAYQTIQGELAAYKINLATKPQIVALNKIDGLDNDIIQSQTEALQRVVPKGTPIMPISAQAKHGVQDLLYATVKLVSAERERQAAETPEDADLPVITLGQDQQLAWRVTKSPDGFVVTGHKIEKFASRTDFSSEHGIERLRDIMQKMGIMHELRRQGIKEGNAIVVAGHGSFKY